MSDTRVVRRIWLNDDETQTASMRWVVDHEEAHIEIRDCSRAINLDFDWDETGTFNWSPPKYQRLAKLDRIITQLLNFRDYLSIAEPRPVRDANEEV